MYIYIYIFKYIYIIKYDNFTVKKKSEFNIITSNGRNFIFCYTTLKSILVKILGEKVSIKLKFINLLSNIYLKVYIWKYEKYNNPTLSTGSSLLLILINYL